jgi:hypothetical protein
LELQESFGGITVLASVFLGAGVGVIGLTGAGAGNGFLSLFPTSLLSKISPGKFNSPKYGFSIEILFSSGQSSTHLSGVFLDYCYKL